MYLPKSKAAEFIHTHTHTEFFGRVLEIYFHLSRKKEKQIVFITLTVFIVLQVYVCVISYQIVHLKHVQLLYINSTLIKL